VTYEQIKSKLLKSGDNQGAQSQAFTSHMKNNVIVVTKEPTIDLIGVMENYLTQNQVKNISDTIKLDVDSYDFTGGSIFYHRYNIYVAIPQEGIVIIYNLTTNSWEAPQTLPISRFYIVDGELYGHSANTSESYQLFTGYADRVYSVFSGFPIDAKARFSYQSYGSRYIYKTANAFYIEGYIDPITTLNCHIYYELDGCMTQRDFQIDGSDKQIVCIPVDIGSFGKSSIGKQKIGGNSFSNLTGLPPKFRVQKTFTSTPFFEASFGFDVLGINNRFELLAFGLNATGAKEEPITIKQ
jgi:hypothetical protein